MVPVTAVLTSFTTYLRIGPHLLGRPAGISFLVLLGCELPEHFLHRDPGEEGRRVPIPDSRDGYSLGWLN